VHANDTISAPSSIDHGTVDMLLKGRLRPKKIADRICMFAQQSIIAKAPAEEKAKSRPVDFREMLGLAQIDVEPGVVSLHGHQADESVAGLQASQAAGRQIGQLEYRKTREASVGPPSIAGVAAPQGGPRSDEIRRIIDKSRIEQSKTEFCRQRDCVRALDQMISQTCVLPVADNEQCRRRTLLR
jgi:hypothetical protein